MLNLNWCLTGLALPRVDLCQFLALFWLFTLQCWHWTQYWAEPADDPSIPASDWSRVITWPEYWPLIGRESPRDPSIPADATNQIYQSNYFTFQLKKYSILKDKWINISINNSCILSASLYFTVETCLSLTQSSFTVDKVRRPRSAVSVFSAV